jgi:hypothetical protein
MTAAYEFIEGYVRWIRLISFLYPVRLAKASGFFAL